MQRKAAQFKAIERNAMCAMRHLITYIALSLSLALCRALSMCSCQSFLQLIMSADVVSLRMNATTLDRSGLQHAMALPAEDTLIFLFHARFHSAAYAYACTRVWRPVKESTPCVQNVLAGMAKDDIAFWLLSSCRLSLRRRRSTSRTPLLLG